MKFVCDSCHTKYSIADERVHGRVLKIRCKTCDHIITVREPAEPKPATPSFADGFGESDHTMVSMGPPASAAAAAPAADDWYVSFDGEQEGPMSLERALERVRAERPKGKEAHAWKPGFFVWLPVEDVPEFARAIESKKPAAPPPMPQAPVRPSRAQPVVRSPSGSQPIAPVSQAVIAKSPAPVAKFPRPDLAKLTDPHPIVVGSATVDSGPVPLLPPPPEAMVPTPLSIPLPMIPAPFPASSEGSISSPMEVQLTKPEPRIARKQLEEMAANEAPIPKPAPVEPAAPELSPLAAAMASMKPGEKPQPLDTGPVPLPPPPGDDFLIGEPSATVNLANLSVPTKLPRSEPRSVETFGGVTVTPPTNGSSSAPAPVVVVAGPASTGAAPWVKASVAVLAVLVVALSTVLLWVVMRRPTGSPTTTAQPTAPNEKVGDEPIAMPDPAPPTTIGPAVDKKAPPAAAGTIKKPSSGKPGKAGDGLTADQRKLAALYAEGGEANTPKDVPAVDRGARAAAQVSQQAILDVVKQNQRALSLCYQRVLKHDTSLKRARLVTHVKIGVSGMVTNVSIPDSELGGAEIGQCITATIKRWRFPSADAEYETEFPIILQAE